MSGHNYGSASSLARMDHIERLLRERGAMCVADLVPLVKLSKGAMANYLRIMWLDGRIKRAPRPAIADSYGQTHYWQIGTDPMACEPVDVELAPKRPVRATWAPNHARDPLVGALFGAPKEMAISGGLLE